MISKALIPIAGTGTRMAPVTHAMPKAMLPLPAGPSSMLPVLHWILAEVAAAGVGEAMLICSAGQVDIVQRYLEVASSAGLPKLPGKIHMELQTRPAGFGDAVATGKEFVGSEPFLLMLGDHVYIPAQGADPCASQVLQAFESNDAVATVGVQSVCTEQLAQVGVPKGQPLKDGLYKCEDFLEKPDKAAAERRLHTPGLSSGHFLGHCGIYVFDPEIFRCLTELATEAARNACELQLADAQSLLLTEHPEQYFLREIKGRAYDTGTPAEYVKAVAAFAERNL